MKFTSKKTGKSFIISGKAAADFLYAKNAKGEFINDLNNYYINKKDDISQVKFFLGCVGMTMLAIGSILLHLQWNF
jgi:hypothetical protein|tara:strand:- start:710 stop:937 length:228 start_codon:yes stop_codon:yes gene_type:complete